MGLFYDTSSIERSSVRDALKEALETDPESVSDTGAEAEKKASEIAPAGYPKFNKGRFIGAAIIFAAIIGGAIATDATGLDDSSKALYGFGATIFGVVVGFLGGEKGAA